MPQRSSSSMQSRRPGGTLPAGAGPTATSAAAAEAATRNANTGSSEKPPGRVVAVSPPPHLGSPSSSSSVSTGRGRPCVASPLQLQLQLQQQKSRAAPLGSPRAGGGNYTANHSRVAPAEGSLDSRSGTASSQNGQIRVDTAVTGTPVTTAANSESCINSRSTSGVPGFAGGAAGGSGSNENGTSAGETLTRAQPYYSQQQQQQQGQIRKAQSHAHALLTRYGNTSPSSPSLELQRLSKQPLTTVARQQPPRQQPQGRAPVIYARRQNAQDAPAVESKRDEDTAEDGNDYYIISDSDSDIAFVEAEDEDEEGNSLNSSFSDTRASGNSPKMAPLCSSAAGSGAPERRSTLSLSEHHQDHVLRGSVPDRSGSGAPRHLTAAHADGGKPTAATSAEVEYVFVEEEDDADEWDEKDFDVESDYDEEDEEMAVQRYMDEGAAHSHAPSTATTAGDEGNLLSLSQLSPSSAKPSDRRSGKNDSAFCSSPVATAASATASIAAPATTASPSPAAARATIIKDVPASLPPGTTPSTLSSTSASQAPSRTQGATTTTTAITGATAHSTAGSSVSTAAGANTTDASPLTVQQQQQQRSPPPVLPRQHAKAGSGNQAYVQHQRDLGGAPTVPAHRGLSTDEGGNSMRAPHPAKPAAVPPSPSSSPAMTPGRSAASSAAAALAAASAAPQPARSVQAAPPQNVYGSTPTLLACQSLSLYDAFFLNKSKTCWLVDDHVLAKCLEFVRLMGYTHPMLRRDRAVGNVNSMWSFSAAVPSPLTRNVCEGEEGKPNAATGRVPPTYSLKRHPPVCVADQLHMSSLFLSYTEAMRWISEQEYVVGTILLCCAKADPPRRGSGRKHQQQQQQQQQGGDGVEGREDKSTSGSVANSRSATPRAASTANGTADGTAGDGRKDLSALPPPLLRRSESTQQQKGASSQHQQQLPAIPPHTHPIQWIAQHIVTNFPHWGDFDSFARVWEVQTRLTLCTSAPSHQRVFHSRDDNLTFYSDMEGGNLFRVERAVEPYVYYIWLEPDHGSDKRIWFRFAIAGAREGRTIRLRLLNAAPHTKLYRENGMSPVFRDGNAVPNWTPVDQCSFRTLNGEEDGEVAFSITVRSSTDTIQVAFCAPYTYADLLCHFCHWHALVRASVCSIRFEERVLCRTPDGRKQHLLIITSPTSHMKQRAKPKAEGGAKRKAPASGTADPKEASLTNVGSPVSTSGGKKKKSGGGGADVVRGPYANFSTGKKVVLVSGRVHPGEVTASHATHGLISFLLSADPRAIQLREHFIFFLVPMMNPDGVSRGHSRLDQFGNNLNRCYNTPDPDTQPTVYALRKVFEHLQKTFRERFIMYLDFHSHASQSSGFMFGNHLPLSVHHWNLVYPKIVELHARDSFSFNLCRFGRVHMVTKDGASRVMFGEGLIHSYTVELPHFTDRQLYGDTLLALNNGGPVAGDEAATVAGGPTSSFAPVDSADDNGGGASGGSGAVMRGRAGSKSKGSGGKAKSRATSESAGARGGRKAAAGGAGSAKRGASVSAGERAGCKDSADTSNPGISANGSGGGSANADQQSAPLLSKKMLRQLLALSDQQSTTLHPIFLPSILTQSASVGRACAFALLDYCAADTKLSPELTAYGGMERVLVEVKRVMKLQAKTKKRKAAGCRARAATASASAAIGPPEQPPTYQQLQQQLQAQRPDPQAAAAAPSPQQQQQQGGKDDFSPQPIFRQY